jgi:hypothetical protein
MIRLSTLTEGIAIRLLARNGIVAIWQLQVAAAIAYRTCNASAAAAIVERLPKLRSEWLRQGNAPTLIGDWQQ